MEFQVLLWRVTAMMMVSGVGIAVCHPLEPIVGAKSALGKIINLPKTDILKGLSSGHALFTSHPESTTEPYSQGGSSMHYFRTSDKLKQHISSDANLDASVASSFSVSTKATFDHLSGFETNVSVAKAYAESIVSVTYVTKENLEKLTLRSDFLSSFNSLPIAMLNEWQPLGWYPIEEFLETWGTHVIVAAYTGATFDAYSVAKSSLEYSQEQLEARACLHAEGFNHALEGCGGFSDAQKRSAIALSASDKRYAKGATLATRTTLLEKVVTRETLDRFLGEASVDDEPIKYHFLPLWSLLRSRFAPRSDNWHRATNLGAYYDGWLGFGCNYVEMELNGVVEPAQWFRFDANNVGYAKCLRRCLGCHSYSEDCFNWNKKCLCGGPSCLVPDDTEHGYHCRVEDGTLEGWEGMGCTYEGSQCLCGNANYEEGCHIKLGNNSHIKYVALWDQTPNMFRDLT